MNQELTQLVQLNVIRTETALSRYPIHRLAKKGSFEIELRGAEKSFKWEVSYNSKYGQPGPLAYKLDTLIINRRIEEAARPLPKFIKLGSLREIANEAGTGEANTSPIKKALYQNAFAAITAVITYRGNNGTECTKEFGDTRYGIVFTGERLPDGREADAVYVILHDWYRDILDTAKTRPLDYDYLKELTPAAQRLYELLSFQMYGSLQHDRPRAKLLYSEFCTFAPQTRYTTFEQVKKQMYKLHVPHKKSGYIATVHFQETTDNTGHPDWEMFYTPGLKARREHKAAREKRQHPRKPKQLEFDVTSAPEQPALDHDPLVIKLIGFHIAEATARELVRDYRKSVELQLQALPYRNTNKIKDLAAWLIVAIKENHQLPKAITEAEAKEEEVRKAQAKKEAAEARQRDEQARRATYFDFLRARAAEAEKTQPETYKSFLDEAAAKRAELERDPTQKGQAKKILLRIFDDEESHLERFKEYFNEPTLGDWTKDLGGEA
jgi:hypothetical protein